MKYIQTITFLILIVTYSFAQTPVDVWRSNPAVSSDALAEAKTVNDLSPQLWQMAQIPNSERRLLDDRAKFSMGFQINNGSNYASLVDVVSSTITIEEGNEKYIVESEGEKLSEEQKKILSTLRSGDEFDVQVQFKHKDFVEGNRVVEANAFVTVLPHQAADYPGGVFAFRDYLENKIWAKVKEDRSYGSQIDMSKVSFTVDKEGKICNVKMTRSAGNEKADQMIIEQISKMPKWIPAKNINGEIVEQEVRYSLGGC